MGNERTITVKVDKAFCGSRLDSALAGLTKDSISRSLIHEHGRDFSLNRKPVKLSTKVYEGDIIRCSLSWFEPCIDFSAEEIPLEVLYEDDWMLVVNKSAGMAVHPSPGHNSGTLVNALLFRYNDLPGDAARAGIVHRLDKDTSGILVCAKSAAALSRLSASFKTREVKKTYQAIVKNRPIPSRGYIDAPIGRDPRNRKKQAVTTKGKEAKTGYRTIRIFKGFSHLSLDLYTGRTHQLRVHLSHIGCPIAGDPLYARSSRSAPRLCLAATALAIPHPQSGEILSFSIKLPEHMKKLLESLESEST